VSLTQTLASLESKHREISQVMREAAESELSQQVKLNSLHESVTREQQRLDQVRQDRSREEEDRSRALEKTKREIEEAKLRIAEHLKQEEASFTVRLKERVRDLEEKHETLRHSLAGSLDESTVMLFAQDIIKRIDLVDILINRFSGSNESGGIEHQLRTLRASFEDILAQHGIHEFHIEPGTEVDTELRQRIAIVENVAGPARSKIVETYRPGFIYAGAGGREVIIRKVEVKTSSE
jgi:chromosome segregation ATPase